MGSISPPAAELNPTARRAAAGGATERPRGKTRLSGRRSAGGAAAVLGPVGLALPSIYQCR
jgi:hypothetical protein